MDAVNEQTLNQYFDLLENTSQHPAFLLLDGHSTHYQPAVIRLAREKEVIILCLPPHITHET
jgi:hypothetical protein